MLEGGGQGGNGVLGEVKRRLRSVRGRGRVHRCPAEEQGERCDVCALEGGHARAGVSRRELKGDEGAAVWFEVRVIQRPSVCRGFVDEPVVDCGELAFGREKGSVREENCARRLERFSTKCRLEGRGRSGDHGSACLSRLAAFSRSPRGLLSRLRGWVVCWR